MATISRDQERKLLEAYERGDTMAMAAKFAGVGQGTAWKRYKRFSESGKQRVFVARRGGTWRRPPRYVGPTWIGKAVDTDSRM